MAWKTPDGTLPVHAVYGSGTTFDDQLLFVTRWRADWGELSVEPPETLKGKTVGSTGHIFDPGNARTWAPRKDLWSQDRVDEYLSIVRPRPLGDLRGAGRTSLYDQLRLRVEAGRLMAGDPALGHAAAMRKAADQQ